MTTGLTEIRCPNCGAAVTVDWNDIPGDPYTGTPAEREITTSDICPSCGDWMGNIDAAVSGAIDELRRTSP